MMQNLSLAISIIFVTAVSSFKFSEFDIFKLSAKNISSTPTPTSINYTNGRESISEYNTLNFTTIKIPSKLPSTLMHNEISIKQSSKYNTFKFTTTEISSTSPSTWMHNNTASESSSEYNTSDFTITKISSTLPSTPMYNKTRTESSSEYNTSKFTTTKIPSILPSTSINYTTRNELGWEYSATELPVSRTESSELSIPLVNKCDSSFQPFIEDTSLAHKEVLNGVLNILRSVFPTSKYYRRIGHYFKVEIPKVLDIAVMNSLLYFADLEIRKSYQHSPNLLHCKFSKYLKVQIPLEKNQFIFYGNIRIRQSSRKHLIGKFKLTFNELTMSIAKNSDSLITTNVEYKNYTVQTNVHPKRQPTVIRAMDKLVQLIKSYLKSSIVLEGDLPHWFSDRMRSSVVLFDVCMDPKFPFTRDKQFSRSTSDKKFYEVIHDHTINSIGSTDLWMNKVSIEGLSNFKSFTSTNYLDGYQSFSLVISNLRGYVDWGYNARSKHHAGMTNIEEFEIQNISIKGDRKGVTSLSFTPTFECLESNDRLTSFTVTRLKEKIKDIIASSLNDTITWCLAQSIEKVKERFYS